MGFEVGVGVGVVDAVGVGLGVGGGVGTGAGVDAGVCGALGVGLDVGVAVGAGVGTWETQPTISTSAITTMDMACVITLIFRPYKFILACASDVRAHCEPRRIMPCPASERADSSSSLSCRPSQFRRHTSCCSI